MTITTLQVPAGPVPAAPAADKSFWMLNWLRFVLAAYIVLFHTLKKYPELADGWWEAALGLGNMATSVFFVLSGFLLTHAYVVMKNGREVNRRGFLTARFSTLYPLHVAGLLLAVIPAAYTIFSRGGLAVPVDLTGTATRMLGNGEVLLAFVMNLLLLNAWNPYYLSFNYPAWSLSALACYYLIFPFIALRIYRMKAPVFALVFLGVAFLLPGAIADILQLTDIVTDGVLHRNPIVRLPLFLAGMVLCVLFSRARKHGSATQALLLGAVVLATFAIAVPMQFVENRPHLIQNGLYYPASLAIIWLCARAPNTQSRTIRYWGVRLGGASLPMFMLHGPLFPLFRAFEKFVKALLVTAEWTPSAIFAAGRGIDQTVGFYGVYLVTLIVLCVFVQERFVAPLQIWIRNRLANRDALRVGEGMAAPAMGKLRD